MKALLLPIVLLTPQLTLAQPRLQEILYDGAGTDDDDALQNGDAGAFNFSEGMTATLASAGKNLSRDRSSTDTDNNVTDFSILAPPTPRSPKGNELRLSVPDTTAAYADTLVVPLRLNGTSGKGLLTAEIFISYDGDLLRADSVLATAMTAGWTVLLNKVDGALGQVDTLKIASGQRGPRRHPLQLQRSSTAGDDGTGSRARAFQRWLNPTNTAGRPGLDHRQ